MTKTYKIGTYGDGTYGHQHTRERCAEIVQDIARTIAHPGERSTGDDLVDALVEEMSDDASEEQDACDWLNEHAAVNNATWGWQDGDFGLWANEGDEARAFDPDPYWPAAEAITELAARKAFEFAYDRFQGADGKHHADLARRDGNELEAATREGYERFFQALAHYVREPDAINFAHAVKAFSGTFRPDGR